MKMYYIKGFRAPVAESDLRWAREILFAIQTWPKKTREVYECVDKCGGFLLMSKPKECLTLVEETEDRMKYCQMCRNCYSKRDRENVHEFLEKIYSIAQAYRLKRNREVPFSLVRFMSFHSTDLFKPHKKSKRLFEPSI